MMSSSSSGKSANGLEARSEVDSSISRDLRNFSFVLCAASRNFVRNLFSLLSQLFSVDFPKRERVAVLGSADPFGRRSRFCKQRITFKPTDSLTIRFVNDLYAYTTINWHIQSFAAGSGDISMSSRHSSRPNPRLLMLHTRLPDKQSSTLQKYTQRTSNVSTL